MGARVTRGATAMVVALCVLVTVTDQPTSAQRAQVPPTGTTIALTGQTSSVAQGGAFEARFTVAGAPTDAQVALVLHSRVRSRTELDASMQGSGLRSQIYSVVMPLASLPAAADGARSVSISLDPATPGGVALTTAGVYPLEIVVQDAAGVALTSVVTHLIVRPDAADQSPPLAVAVVASIDEPPSRRASGEVDIDDETAQAARGLAQVLAARSDVPATLAFRPETLEALLADEPSGDLGTALQTAAESRSVLPLPYVEVSPDALVAAELTGELDLQLERGRAVLGATLGVDPSADTWVAGPDLDLAGVRELARRGVRHLVVDSDRIEPLRPGVASLSLAQPFVIEDERQPLVDALTLDPGVTARLGTDETPALEVSRVLAELAVLWFEQPGIARAVVVPVDPTVRAAVVDGLLAGLDSGGPLQASSVDDLFASASPLRQPGGGRVDRTLQPAAERPIGAAVARELRATRPLVASLGTMLGADHPDVVAAQAHLLVATSADASSTARRDHVRSARAAVDDTVGAITAPPRESITLTARDGSVPLTLQNATGGPVDVVVRFRSAKAEFPEGATLPVRLTDPTTRLNVPIRARASGTFPLEVSVTAPDGVLTLARIGYTVQSTAVSGVGLVLSIGAAVFLLVWWGRHWRTRRSEKLVQPTDQGPPVADN